MEPKAPQSMNEVVEALRGWRRSLRRAQELDIATPDATLLLGALDKMSELVGRTSSQVAFRMSSTRATLGVDVTPTLETVLNFSDMLTAEAESLAISELQPVQEIKTAPLTTKVKAMTAAIEEKVEKNTEKSKGEGKSEEKTCRFGGSEDGCRKGQECRFKHDWGGLEKKGRCFGRSSTKHTKKECPATKQKMEGDKRMKTFKKGTEKGYGVKKVEKTEGNPENQQTLAEEVMDEKKVERPAASSGEVQALLSEATTLLKSLRPASDGRTAVKAIKLSSLEVRTNDRALLDGGATHCLRKAELEEEWQRAQEVRVELAEGSVTLRQIPWTKTLLTQNEVQTIVVLGVLISLGYDLHHRASKAARPRMVVTALEQPDDPEAYLGEAKRGAGGAGADEKPDELVGHPRYPTYWSELWGLFEVRFDQGPMGHARRKPTRLGTNMLKLVELEGLRGPGHGGEDHRGDSIQARIARSKSWASWASRSQGSVGGGREGSSGLWTTTSEENGP